MSNRQISLSVGRSIVTIGRFTYGYNALDIKQWGEGCSLTIGAFCSISTGVRIFLGGNHRTDWITTFPFGHIFKEELGEDKTPGHPSSKGDVLIGNDVWIASNATIMSGVEISDGAVVGANAVVTTSIGPYEIHAGNPSKLIRKRFDDTTISALLKLRWWDLDISSIKELKPLLTRAPESSLLEHLLERFRPEAL